MKGLNVDKFCTGFTLGRGAGIFVKFPYSKMVYFFVVGVPKIIYYVLPTWRQQFFLMAVFLGSKF